MSQDIPQYCVFVHDIEDENVRTLYANTEQEGRRLGNCAWKGLKKDKNDSWVELWQRSNDGFFSNEGQPVAVWGRFSKKGG